jgi:hypothetical protein
MMDHYQQIILASRPTGAPVAENFRLESGPTPVPADGEILVRARYLSLDPYMRGRMSDAKSYAKPVEIGEPMEGETVAEVLESRHAEYRPGDLVQARIGWRTHAAISVAGVRRVNPGLAPITTALGVLGMPGFTAYVGMKVIGQPKPGETVVVAAGKGRIMREGSSVALLSFGTRLAHCLSAAEMLASHGLTTTVADARFAKPLDVGMVLRLAREHKVLITVEEAAIGGFSAQGLQVLTHHGALDNGLKVRCMILPDVFIEHDSPAVMYAAAGLDAKGIVAKVFEALGKKDARREFAKLR